MLDRGLHFQLRKPWRSDCATEWPGASGRTARAQPDRGKAARVHPTVDQHDMRHLRNLQGEGCRNDSHGTTDASVDDCSWHPPEDPFSVLGQHALERRAFELLAPPSCSALYLPLAVIPNPLMLRAGKDSLAARQPDPQPEFTADGQAPQFPAHGLSVGRTATRAHRHHPTSRNPRTPKPATR